MTGVITDMGIELGKLLYWNRLSADSEKEFVKANRDKLKTHVFIFTMFLTGGIIGAVSFKQVGYISVVPLSFSLFLIAGLQIFRDFRAIFRH
jgi:uncharacterized membrane protein YoaK (UPF0700 family)